MSAITTTNISKYPYIPDLDVFYQFYDKLINADNLCNLSKGEALTNFFVKRGFVIEENGHYTISKSVDLSDKETRDDVLLNYLLKWKDVKDVCQFIGDEGKSLEEIKLKFQNSYNDDNIRVIVAWLERLNYIIIRKDKYQLNLDTIEKDDIDSSSIYPLSYKHTVDIQEDKYSVYEYLRKVNRGMIVMNPDFQRNLVWKDEQKSQFIESTILQIPIPPFYLKRTEDNKYVIIDGLQRTSALMDFADNKFKLCGLKALSDLNGENFESLKKVDSAINTRFEDKQLYFYILQPTVPMSIVYDIFNRINTGGTKLERQEVRNCIFIGKATRLLKQIAETPDFIRAIDHGISDKRMKAREAILRCIAFVILSIDTYQGSMDDFLEKAMRKLNRYSDTEIQDLQNRVLDTFNTTYRIFGNKNFRIPALNSRGRINIAVMEAVFNCFWNFKVKSSNENETFMTRYNKLLEDRKFLDSVKASTSSKSNVSERFEKSRKYLIN